MSQVKQAQGGRSRDAERIYKVEAPTKIGTTRPSGFTEPGEFTAARARSPWRRGIDDCQQAEAEEAGRRAEWCCLDLRLRRPRDAAGVALVVDILPMLRSLASFICLASNQTSAPATDRGGLLQGRERSVMELLGSPILWFSSFADTDLALRTAAFGPRLRQGQCRGGHEGGGGRSARCCGG